MITRKSYIFEESLVMVVNGIGWSFCAYEDPNVSVYPYKFVMYVVLGFNYS